MLAPPLSRRAMREGAALSRSPGVFDQGNDQTISGIHPASIRDYHRPTVQAGEPMTVKEMGLERVIPCWPFII